MRLIDADALEYVGNHIGDEDEDRFHDKQWIYRDQIDNAPTIEPNTNAVTESMMEQAYEEGKVIGRRCALTVMESLFHTEPKRGEWVNHEEPCVNGGYWHYVMCTACKAKAITPTNFCPNCGADMRGDTGK